MKNGYAFDNIYPRLGVDPKALGCLMLDTDAPYRGSLRNVDDIEYYSPDPKQFWMRGALSDWHLTIRMGFLPSVTDEIINEIMAGVELPSTLHLTGTEVFESPFEDQPYECLVVRVQDKALDDLHRQFGILPNVAIFPEYKAHITVGYFKLGQSPDLEIKGEVNTRGWTFDDNQGK